MLPQRLHGKGPAQQVHLALRVAAPDKDQPPLGMGLQVQLPGARERAPQRCRLDACGGALPVRCHVAGRLCLHARQGVVVEPCPDLGLPEPVEALDGRLKPVSRGGTKTGITPRRRQVRVTRPMVPG